MSDESYEVKIPDEPSIGSAVVVDDLVWVNSGLVNMEWVCPMVQVRGIKSKPKGAPLTDADVRAAYARWENLLRKGKVTVIYRAG